MIKIRSFANFIILCGLTAMLSCSNSAKKDAELSKQMMSPGDQSLVAQVDDLKITLDDWNYIWKMLPPYSKKRFDSPEGKKQLLDRLIARLLFYKEGVLSGIVNEPDLKRTLEEQRLDTVSDVVKSRYLEDKRDEKALKSYFRKHKNNYKSGSRPAKFEEVKGRVAEDLSRELLNEYAGDLRKKSKILINEDIIK